MFDRIIQWNSLGLEICFLRVKKYEFDFINPYRVIQIIYLIWNELW